jgi:hypothetical protein
MEWQVLTSVLKHKAILYSIKSGFSTQSRFINFGKVLNFADVQN